MRKIGSRFKSAESLVKFLDDGGVALNNNNLLLYKKVGGSFMCGNPPNNTFKLSAVMFNTLTDETASAYSVHSNPPNKMKGRFKSTDSLLKYLREGGVAENERTKSQYFYENCTYMYKDIRDTITRIDVSYISPMFSNYKPFKKIL